ncbi:SHOCT domain-containing protein [Burkholderia gladioli]|uniref:SHOCT domain-containing protein n=1 Tax=Burkholderia gladioli TaxID=28095 RepID=UPI00163E7920|nr:SHOCT domain-containing protein [Burkholderia gladioli]
MSTTAELERLAALREQGLLSEEEFERAKRLTLRQASDRESEQPRATSRPPEKSNFWRIVRWVIGIAAVLFIVMLIIGSNYANSPEGRAKLQSKASIERCWAEQARKSLDPSSQRMMARMCEILESQYRDKYGTSP